MNVTRHHRARGKLYGVKFEMACKGLPMTLLNAIRNVPMQWRMWWGGPTCEQSPTVRVLWGWPSADGWTAGYAYVRHEPTGATRVKWTCSRSAICLHTGDPLVPLGRWGAVLTCEPDEESPMQIALIARPLVYVPRPVPKPLGLPVPNVSVALPSLRLPHG